MAVAKANYGYASYSSVAQPVISQAEFSINAEIAYNEIQRRKNDSGQLLYQGTQDNLLDINEHELVFVRSAERHGPAPVVSQGPKCLSSFNLLKTGTINEFNLQRIETSPMKVAHEIAKQFRFLGVAKYTKQYNSAKYDHKHSALAVAAGGTRTIINTGAFTRSFNETQNHSKRVEPCPNAKRSKCVKTQNTQTCQKQSKRFKKHSNASKRPFKTSDPSTHLLRVVARRFERNQRRRSSGVELA